MPKFKNLHKPKYGQPSRDALHVPKKKKQTAGRAHIEKLTLRADKDGRIPSVPENWEDEIIKENGADRFWEHVVESEHKKHPVMPAGYEHLCICPETKDRVAIPGDSVLKFRFEQGQFPLSSSKFANSQSFQGWDDWVNKALAKPANAKVLSSAGVFDAIRISTRILHIKKEKTMEIWCAILARWSTSYHTMITA